MFDQSFRPSGPNCLITRPYVVSLTSPSRVRLIRILTKAIRAPSATGETLHFEYPKKLYLKFMINYKISMKLKCRSVTLILLI